MVARLTTFLLLFLTACLACAETKSWDKGAGTNSWSDAANWEPDGVPTSADDVRFDNSRLTGEYRVEIQSPASCRTLTLGDPTSASTITLELTSAASAALEIAGSGDPSDDLVLLAGARLVNATSGPSPALNNASPGATTRVASGATVEWRSSSPIDSELPASGNGATRFETGSNVLFYSTPPGGIRLSGLTLANVAFRADSPTLLSAFSQDGTTFTGTLDIGPNVTLDLASSAAIVFKSNLIADGIDGRILGTPTCFIGSTTYSGSGTTLTLAGDWTLQDPATLRLNKPLEVCADSNAQAMGFLVTNSALYVRGFLQTGTHRITGTGLFSLEGGATLGIQHEYTLDKNIGVVKNTGGIFLSPDATYLFNGPENQFQVIFDGLPEKVHSIIFDCWSLQFDDNVEVTGLVEYRKGLIRSGSDIIGPDAPEGVTQSEGHAEVCFKRRMDYAHTGKRIFPVATYVPGGVDIDVTSPGSGTGVTDVTIHSYTSHPAATGSNAWSYYTITPPAQATGYKANVTLRMDRQDLNWTVWYNPVVACYRNGAWQIYRDYTGTGANGVSCFTVNDVTDVSGDWTVGEITSFPAPLDVDVVPSVINFGQLDTQQTYGWQPITIRNNGTPQLLEFSGQGIWIDGPDADHFMFVDEPDTSPLSSAWDRTLYMYLAPQTHTGAVSASLMLQTNDPDEPLLSVPINATFVHPDITVTPPGYYDFANTHLDAGTSTTSFQITNNGSTELVFLGAGIELVEYVRHAFTLVDTPSTAPLAPGESRTVTVAFDPSTTTSYSANLHITTNDFDQPEVWVYISGTGALQDLSLSPMAVNYSLKVVTEPPTRARSIIVQNTGNYPLRFTGEGIRLLGPNSSDFLFTTAPLTADLAAGEWRTIDVAFAPTSVGSKSATIEITTDDPDQPTANVVLTGTGVEDRATTLSGAYNGWGPGISTIGTAGDYPTLRSACEAISTCPLTGSDWTFLIISDLPDTPRCYLSQYDTNGHKIVMRPAPGLSPVISFTTIPASGPLPMGHWNIGIDRSADPYRYNTISTENIIIDGCNTPGGTTRNLTMRNVQRQGYATTLLQAVGDCNHIRVQNCILQNNAIASSGNCAAITVASHVSMSGVLSVPDDCTVEGCDVVSSGSAGSSGITFPQFSDYGAQQRYPASASTDIAVRRNQVSAAYSAITVGYVTNCDVDNNTVRVNQNYGYNGGVAIAYSLGNSYGATYPGTRVNNARVNISGNNIQQVRASNSSGSSITGIQIDNSGSSCTYNIVNNMIGGMMLAYNSPASCYGLAGIRVNSASNSRFNIQHNSIHILASQAQIYGLNPDNCCGISFANGSFFGTADIRNNVMRIAQPNASALQFTGSSGQLTSDYNDLCVPGAGSILARRNWTSYTTLSDWQGYSLQDSHSITLDPADTSATAHWKTSEAEQSDLHFTAHPGRAFLGTPIAEVLYDIDGELRSPSAPLMGADEVMDHDMDGVADDVEDSAPNAGDANRDGIADKLQPHVASVPNLVDGRYLVLVADPSTALTQVAAGTPPADFPTANASFPFGMLGFHITGLPYAGATVTVKLYLPDSGGVNRYFKHSPTPGNPVPHWHIYDYDGGTGSQISGSVVTLQLVDGGKGDSDMTANGEIDDPGAPVALGAEVPDWAIY